MTHVAQTEWSDDSHNIPITLKVAGAGTLSVTAFHEKAGRSQVDLEELLRYKKTVTLTSSPTSDLLQNGQL